MRRRHGLTRRAVLAGAAAVAGGAALRPKARAASAPVPVVDVHCHTFCTADLPMVGFVAHQIPGLVEVSRFLTRWPEVVARTLLRAVTTLPNAVAPSGEAELESLRALAARPGPPAAAIPPLPPGALDDLLASAAQHLPVTLPPDLRRSITRALETLYLVAHPRLSIAATLVQTYPGVSLFTPALVDYDAWSDDQPPTPLWQQVLVQEQIARLSVAGRVGRPDARIHPFVAFDPRRQASAPAPAGGKAPPVPSPGPASTALDLVRYAIHSAGFTGVKLYPSVGFAPFDNARVQPRLPFAGALDAALGQLYGLCESEEIPILTHASEGNAYSIGLSSLVTPERWRPALERFPLLRLNLGHFGGELRPWIDEAVALIDRYPNVYADLSNSALVYDDAYATKFRGDLVELMERHPRLKGRLMYGSDWWLSALEPGAAQAIDWFRTVLPLSAAELADVMGRNALRFLGFLDDQNRPRAGLASRRLRAFYGNAPRPAWL